MRNNEDRFGAVPPESAPMPMNASTLDFVVPTDLVELPSKGLFYPPDHPLHRKEFVEIKHMTAKEEDILTSGPLIEKGVVLDYLLKSLLIDKSINPASLLPGDQNAIYVSARINAYGPEYSFNYTCENCGNKFTTEIDLSELKTIQIDQNLINDDGTATVFLEKTQKKVKLRQFTSYLNSLMEKEASQAIYGVTVVFLKYAILYIDDVVNDGSLKIMNFLENLPSKDVAAIKSFYSNNRPDIDFKASLTCNKCGHSKEGNVPITANFFWPGS